jgi:alkylated DNA repair dioxygenase AlkB
VAKTHLPLDCEAFYDPVFLTSEESKTLFSEITGRYDIFSKTIRMHDGSEFTAETSSYLFADSELTSFDAFAEVWGARSPWPDFLRPVKQRIEETTGHQYQVARCVYYQDGNEGMGFHQDLAAYGPTNAIASLSLGAKRDFVFRSVSDPGHMHRLSLEDGSLLFMGEHCQDRYEHAVPYSPHCLAPRLNITFRKYGFREDFRNSRVDV